MYNGLDGSYYTYPLYFSCVDCWNGNLYSQTTTTGSIPIIDSQSGNISTGNYSTLGIGDVDDKFLVMPGYGLITYIGGNYTDVCTLDYKNRTNKPICVGSGWANTMKSYKIYYNDVELLLP